jgi:hypothetical protein
MATIHIPGLALFRCQDDWQGSLKGWPKLHSIQQSKGRCALKLRDSTRPSVRAKEQADAGQLIIKNRCYEDFSR